MLIASTTKILTALVVLEHARLDEVVTIQPRHMAEGSSMYLKPGETLTVETLLYGLLLCSGNDAAVALADHCGGSVARFVGWMNETAQRIGMTGSSFANPNGLDDEQHYSTARDMALLAAYAARNPTFVRLCSTRSVTVGGRTMTNHNKLLQSVEGCIGMKTGYTKAAGRTLVSCVRRDGRTLVAVTLQDGNDWAGSCGDAFASRERINPFWGGGFASLRALPCRLRQGCDTAFRAGCFLRRTRRRKKRISIDSRRCGAANAVRPFLRFLHFLILGENCFDRTAAKIDSAERAVLAPRRGRAAGCRARARQR